MERLYTTEDRRFFLVPDALDLPSGELELISMTGQLRRRVAETSVQPYAATREQAKAWIQSQASEVFDRAQAGVGELLRRWKQGREPPPWSQRYQDAGPGLRLLAALTDFDAEALAQDPEQVREAGATLAERLDAFLARARDATDEAAKEELRAEGRRFLELVRIHGIAAPPSAQESLDALIDGLASGAFAAEARRAAERLEASFASIDTWADVAKQGLEAMATRLRRAAGAAERSES